MMLFSEMVRLNPFHRLQLRTHVINFRLRLQLFENGVIDYKLQLRLQSRPLSFSYYMHTGTRVPCVRTSL